MLYPQKGSKVAKNFIIDLEIDLHVSVIPITTSLICKILKFIIKKIIIIMLNHLASWLALMTDRQLWFSFS